MGEFPTSHVDYQRVHGILGVPMFQLVFSIWLPGPVLLLLLDANLESKLPRMG